MKLKKVGMYLAILSICGSILSGCNKKEEEPVEVFVLAAASLTDAMGELKTLFESSHEDVLLTCSFGSSGALQTQIEEGAPADVFFSAGAKQVNALIEKGLVEEAGVTGLLVNEIVLITSKDNASPITSFEELSNENITYIAVGDPSSVPAGQYSAEIFETLGMTDALKDKFNYGTDVRQVLTWVETNEAEYGLVYASDALTSDLVKVVCEAPKDSHKKIIYPVALIKQSENAEVAKELIEFFQSDEAKEIFTKYGFDLNQE